MLNDLSSISILIMNLNTLDESIFTDVATHYI